MSKKNQTQEIIDANTFSLDLLTFDGPDDSDMWTDQYPFIQWNNREKAWEFPLKYWAGTEIETAHELIEVDHGEDTEYGFLLPEINVSIVAWRFTWERQGADGQMEYSATPSFTSGERWSKRYNFLAIVQEVGSDDPAIITAKGYTGEYLYNALNQGRKRTLKMVRKLTGKDFPGYLFWTTLAAGEKRMAGKDKKSPIYPPAPIAFNISELDQDGIANLIQSLYIGDELASLIGGSLYSEGQKWAVDVPERLALSARSEGAEIAAEILPGGVLWLPDLADRKKSDWIDCGMSIPDLFDHREHASNAFAKVLRSQGLANAAPPNQWEAWRTELERRWAEKFTRNEAEEVEQFLANGG